jgi:hypothetical protein
MPYLYCTHCTRRPISLGDRPALCQAQCRRQNPPRRCGHRNRAARRPDTAATSSTRSLQTCHDVKGGSPGRDACCFSSVGTSATRARTGTRGGSGRVSPTLPPPAADSASPRTSSASAPPGRESRPATGRVHRRHLELLVTRRLCHPPRIHWGRQFSPSSCAFMVVCGPVGTRSGLARD